MSHPALLLQGSIPGSSKQSGTVLLMSLALLFVVSLLGLSSMRGALTEELISINIQDHHLATESAESALRAGERTLKYGGANNTDPGYYSSYNNPINAPDLYSWDDTNSYKIASDIWVNSNQPIPRYKIELFASIHKKKNVLPSEGTTEAQALAASTKYYRIIAYGQGRSENAVVLEESIVIHK
ncbi:MAG: hypothetical protein GY697_16040 [Desulfobacterales bacterium]|nr:hypothetical protein [Desulfobacterales bacterium]